MVSQDFDSQLQVALSQLDCLDVPIGRKRIKTNKNWCHPLDFSAPGAIWHQQKKVKLPLLGEPLKVGKDLPRDLFEDPLNIID